MSNPWLAGMPDGSAASSGDTAREPTGERHGRSNESRQRPGQRFGKRRHCSESVENSGGRAKEWELCSTPAHHFAPKGEENEGKDKSASSFVRDVAPLVSRLQSLAVG